MQNYGKRGKTGIKIWGVILFYFYRVFKKSLQ